MYHLKLIDATYYTTEDFFFHRKKSALEKAKEWAFWDDYPTWEDFLKNEGFSNDYFELTKVKFEDRW